MATRLIAILLLLAVLAPFAMAVVPHMHDECGMEMCKRAGKCCCKRPVRPGQRQWGATDPCDDAPRDSHTFASPQAIAHTPSASTPVSLSELLFRRTERSHSSAFAFKLFSRPPPSSL